MKILAKVLVGAVADVVMICNVLLVIDLIGKSVEFHKNKKAKKEGK